MHVSTQSWASESPAACGINVFLSSELLLLGLPYGRESKYTWAPQFCDVKIAQIAAGNVWGVCMVFSWEKAAFSLPASFLLFL